MVRRFAIAALLAATPVYAQNLCDVLPVLCTPTPAATATPEGTQTPGGTETPGTTPTESGGTIEGGTATVTSVADSFGNGGETVSAGAFEVGNSSDVDESVTDVDIEVSDTRVISSLTLTGIANGSSTSATISNPSESNRFTFPTPLLIPKGEIGTFTLTATIASTKTSTTTTAQPTAAATAPGTATPTGTPTPTVTGTPPTPTPTLTQTATPTATPIGGVRLNVRRVMFAGVAATPRDSSPLRALLVFEAGAALLGLAIGGRPDRRRFAVVAFAASIVALLWMQGLSGCGSEQSSTQTVTRIGGTNGTDTVTFGGVPLTLGRVARPEQFTFHGKIVTQPTAAATATP